MCLCNNYCSEIRKLLVEICDSLHIAFHLIIETSSTQQDCCMLLVTGGWCRHIGPRGPGVSATDDSITAARLIGTRQGVETRRPTVAAAVSAFLVLLLEVRVLGDGTEHVFCHLQNLLSGCLGGIMKLAVEENKDIVD